MLAFILVSTALINSIATGTEPPHSQAQPPFWAEKGAYVYRVSTPDKTNVFPEIDEGAEMVSHLLDTSIPQILLLNGIIGHDHQGPWNWDGLWPYWNHVTFRGNGDFKSLYNFMKKAHRNANAWISFHLNLTDVNIGLRDYPETREFFNKLAEKKAVYRRDYSNQTRKRDGIPYVPEAIDKYCDQRDRNGNPDPVQIFALVNYKNFWDSGIAREMIDKFYNQIPYAPPFLYLDVFNLAGGNFNTGFPDGPLGGSRESQLAGATAIIDYLRLKGTDLGTEGDRPEFGSRESSEARAGYVWLHGNPGHSSDDYRIIRGATPWLHLHHVYGNPGGFNLSPIALAPEKIAQNKAHYEALLAGRPGLKPVAGLADERPPQFSCRRVLTSLSDSS